MSYQIISGTRMVSNVLKKSYNPPPHVENGITFIDIVAKDNGNTAINTVSSSKWQVNDGWEVQILSSKKLAITKFKIDTWGLRQIIPNPHSTFPNYNNLKLNISGISYVHNNIVPGGFKKAYGGNGGYNVYWYPGQFNSGASLQGFCIQFGLGYIANNNERDDSFQIGRHPWDIGTRVGITDGIIVGPWADGSYKAITLGIYGGNQTAQSWHDESGDAYLTYDISEHPIIIDFEILDFSQPVDITTVECWKSYLKNNLVYNKDKTLENCWKYYGLAHDISEHVTSVDMGGVSSIITNPILPSITDLEEHLIPTIASGIKQVTFNHKFYNPDLLARIKQYYATHDLIVQGEGTELYYTATPTIQPIKGINMDIGDITFRISGNYYYISSENMFSSVTANKITLKLGNAIHISSPSKLFRNCTFNDIEILSIDDESKRRLLGANDVNALCEYSTVPSTFPGIIDWSLRYTNGNTCISWIFSNSTNLVEFTQTGEDRYADCNRIVINGCVQAFENCNTLEKIGPILDVRYINSKQINNKYDNYNMYRMFYNCKNLSDIRIYGLNGSYASFCSDTEIGNLTNLNKESIDYLFANLQDLSKYDETIAIATPDNCFYNWELVKSLLYATDYAIIKTAYRVTTTSNECFAYTNSSINTIINVSNLLNDDILIFKTDSGESILTNGENILASNTGGKLILRNSTVTEPTKMAPVIHVSFKVPYDPYAAKTNQGALHCPSEWFEHYSIPPFDFSTMTNSGGVTIHDGTNVILTNRMPITQSATSLYTTKNVNIKIEIVGLKEGDVLGVGGGSYDTIQNKITEDGTYELNMTGTWGFKLWNNDTTINSDISITSLGHGDLVEGKVSKTMISRARDKNWFIYNKNELVSPPIKIDVGILFNDMSRLDYTEIDYNELISDVPAFSREDIIGITLKLPNNKTIIISPDKPTKAYFCGGSVRCPDAVCETSTASASGKYDGRTATDTFRTTLTVQSWAVNVAYNKMINGQHCYLPYAGELLAIFNKRHMVNLLLKYCGCSALPSDGDYWSSTLLGRLDSTDVNSYLNIMAGINWGGGQYWGLNVQGFYYVLPITELN